MVESRAILQRLIKEEVEFSDSADQTFALMKSGTIPSGAPFPPFEVRARGRFRVSAAVGSGFDSNVLLVEEAVASGIPISNRGSFFITPGAQVGYSGRLYGKSIESRYLASFTDYLNQLAKPFNSFYQRADVSFGEGQTHYGIFGDTYFLNKAPNFSIYDWEAGGSWSRVIQANERHVLAVEVPVQYQKYINDPTALPENDRTGMDLKAKGTYRWLIGDAEMVSVQLALDGQFAKGMNYRTLGVDIPIQWIKPLPYLKDYGFMNTFSLEGQGTNYYRSVTRREDFLIRVGAGIARSFYGFATSLDYSYQKNTSNLSTARYSKGIIALQISHEIL